LAGPFDAHPRITPQVVIALSVGCEKPPPRVGNASSVFPESSAVPVIATLCVVVSADVTKLDPATRPESFTEFSCTSVNPAGGGATSKAPNELVYSHARVPAGGP
jgi:hypothetical protein